MANLPPLPLIRERVKDRRKPPQAQHRIVECKTCHEKCYSLGESDSAVLVYARTEYICTRCWYASYYGKMMKHQYEEMMDHNVERDN